MTKEEIVENAISELREALDFEIGLDYSYYRVFIYFLDGELKEVPIPESFIEILQEKFPRFKPRRFLGGVEINKPDGMNDMGEMTFLQNIAKYSADEGADGNCFSGWR